MLFAELGGFSMAFCQVVLRHELVETVKDNPYGLPWWKKAYDLHHEEQPNDPVPFVILLYPEVHRSSRSFNIVADT